ncbi:hypothetical protein ACPOL_4762 [Acidisarcina polymorpha]|uniref:Uncharacterized protein n=1 Tax=Acidisarcina polymorpha TaxID=2211140 RepID=A0A2Z5G4K0_9BACT|nr:hypothetical protein ACPOL_4762 [Acidisarcina polymorpha]
MPFTNEAHRRKNGVSVHPALEIYLKNMGWSPNETHAEITGMFAFDTIPRIQRLSS